MGQLHLRITKRNGRWYCSEVDMLQVLGYGRYEFYLASRVDSIDKNEVVGLFVYQDDSYEIDIEFSRWGGLATNSQYVVQPGPYTDRNLHRFNMQLHDNLNTHDFEWTRTSTNFRSLQGHDIEPSNPDCIIAEWAYRGDHIPIPGKARLLINLWVFHGSMPPDGREPELILRKFRFRPEGLSIP